MDEPFVGKYYQMNPETDRLLFDATELHDGMTILIENPEVRIDVSRELDEEAYDLALRWNRWARTSHVVIDEQPGILAFIATYYDGSQKKIVIGSKHAWLAKKLAMESTPVTDYRPRDEYSYRTSRYDPPKDSTAIISRYEAEQYERDKLVPAPHDEPLS